MPFFLSNGIFHFYLRTGFVFAWYFSRDWEAWDIFWWITHHSRTRWMGIQWWEVHNLCCLYPFKYKEVEVFGSMTNSISSNRVHCKSWYLSKCMNLQHYNNPYVLLLFCRFLVNTRWNCLAITPWSHMPTWMSIALLFLQLMIGLLDVRSIFFHRFYHFELPVKFNLRHQVLWCSKIVYKPFNTALCIYSLMVNYKKKHSTRLIFN